jgi:glycosyltransferase involved in cell wall biosynthesis
MVAGLRLGRNIDFVGAMSHSQVAQYYKKADIFVSMSARADGFSSVCLEAMASGLAIVASPAFSEAISDGRNGYLVKPGDHREVVAKIAGLIDNRARMHELGSSARRDAVARFDWDRAIIPKYLEVYEELLQTK